MSSPCRQHCCGAALKATAAPEFGSLLWLSSNFDIFYVPAAASQTTRQAKSSKTCASNNSENHYHNHCRSRQSGTAAGAPLETARLQVGQLGATRPRVRLSRRSNIKSLRQKYSRSELRVSETRLGIIPTARSGLTSEPLQATCTVAPFAMGAHCKSCTALVDTAASITTTTAIALASITSTCIACPKAPGSSTSDHHQYSLYQLNC